jgi:uncharacterized membrane protein
MNVETQLLVGWLLFGGTHVLGSSRPVRTRLIDRLGLLGFKAVYSIVALATFVPLVWVFWHNRHEGRFLFVPGPVNTHVSEALMLFSLLFLVLAFATPNPSTTVAELSGRFVSAARGVHKVTRHPMNTAFALFGAAHMVSNPSVGDWIFWGGWVVYSVISALHQDRRMLATGPEAYRSFHAGTSLIPFAAILSGRQKLALRDVSWAGVVVAVALFGVLRWLHPVLIGGFR